MLAWFNSRSADDRRAAELYGAVVAQARTPAFYAECGIQDTPEGRYELIVLHLVLLLERLGAVVFEGPGLPRLVVEAFVSDMDDSLREMGVGDLGVPKKVKKAAGGLYDRAAEYGAALRDADPAALHRCLQTNIPGLSDRPVSCAAFAGYVRAAMQHLSGLDEPRVVAGEISFPRPEFGGASHGVLR